VLDKGDKYLGTKFKHAIVMVYKWGWTVLFIVIYCCTINKQSTLHQLSLVSFIFICFFSFPIQTLKFSFNFCIFLL
jgi:hypothetical protein